jgi:truncated hemoglobin YjbI
VFISLASLAKYDEIKSVYQRMFWDSWKHSKKFSSNWFNGLADQIGLHNLHFSTNDFEA